jgi:hypothetical protein
MANYSPDRVDFIQLLKMSSAVIRAFPTSKLAFTGVSRLLYRLCKFGNSFLVQLVSLNLTFLYIYIYIFFYNTAEFSCKEILKMGCDDAFLETLLWAIENSLTSSSCSRFLQVLRSLFHAKGM